MARGRCNAQQRSQARQGRLLHRADSMVPINLVISDENFFVRVK